MARKQYSEEEVLRALKKKNDVLVDSTKKKVFVIIGDKASNDLGNGSQGKIDYLINHCGYDKIKVTEW